MIEDADTAWSPPARAWRARLADRPLRVKLAMVLALCGGATALLACLTMIAAGWRAASNFAHDESTELTRLIGFSLQAPVVFEDAKGIADS